MKKNKTCEICDKEFLVSPYRAESARFCSRSCKGVWIGKVRRAKAKPRISTQGYYYILDKEYHRANKQGYAKVADIVAEKHFGVVLKKGQIVHHKDGNKLNDSPDNLEILETTTHNNMHLIESCTKKRIRSLLRKCSIPFCEQKHQARNLCKYHYKRVVSRGVHA